MAKRKLATVEKKRPTNAKEERRPPVVAILGHVDHGKTTILDYIRKSRVAEKETGGITQHIGSYQIEYKNKEITFIDTPGHEAFSAMRARGGKVSDIAVLVIAADDGVMPQTKESIAHIKAAKIPFIVAINKIDKPGVNVEKIKSQLSKEGIAVEGYGGDVVVVPVSGKTGQGIDDLLEMIDLVADIAELKSIESAQFEGVVIESKLDKFRGPIATIIVKEGTLKVGSHVHSSLASGKVKALFNYLGKNIKEALPGTPVEILGFSKVPKIGDMVTGTEERSSIKPEEGTKKLSLKERIARPKENEILLIIKADVTGSLEAITSSMESLKEEDQKIKIYFSETGDISEGDVLLAAATGSLIIGFNVGISPTAKRLAGEEKVLIREFSLIYELLEELKEGLESLKETAKEEEILGEAAIVAVFKTPDGRIAGCRVSSGRINKSDTLIIKAGEKEKGRSPITSLKQRESNINEATEGDEFGILLEKGVPFTKGDIISAIGQS